MSFVAIFAVLLFMLVAHRLGYDERPVRIWLILAMLAFGGGHLLMTLAEWTFVFEHVPEYLRSARMMLAVSGAVFDLVGVWFLFVAAHHLRKNAKEAGAPRY